MRQLSALWAGWGPVEHVCSRDKSSMCPLWGSVFGFDPPQEGLSIPPLLTHPVPATPRLFSREAWYLEGHKC